MKRLKQPLIFAAVMSLAYSSAAVAATDCTFNGSNSINVNFGASLANGSLTIARDTPNGTVVYEESQSMIATGWSCNETAPYGVLMNPSLGSVSAKVSTFPLGNTGLSFRIWIDALSRYESSVRPMEPGNYGIPAGSYRLEIVKSGELASQVKIEAGSLATLIHNNLTLKAFLLSNPLILNASSCQTPSVQVAMGDDYQLHEFGDAGATPRTVRFDIGLNQCQAGIKKVTYALKPTTPVIDAAKGIVALNGSSTATGIGLQVMDEAGQPIVFGAPYTFGGFTTTGTNFKIPLSAAYYRLPTGELKAGSANTEVTFIMNYL
ncbi:oxidoreductase [Pseudomonas sp. S35]|uniref:fimbrial protein n=1 Tax=Pseudomonas sp. S35 TaxID=1573719 RepID=UPI00132E9E03|nr:fimbrial protein [Pseudomonas sp. S35]QHF45610.1 oxidoreductase [Pseudomonas sp. S35]